MISVVIGWWWKGGGVDFRKEILMISYSKDLPFQVLFLKKKKIILNYPSTNHPVRILFNVFNNNLIPYSTILNNSLILN